MPRLKQLPSLKIMAEEALLKYVVRRCKELGEATTPDEFYFRIAGLKKILKDMPPKLLGDLKTYNKFLKKFYEDPRENLSKCGNAPLSIIFDVKIPELSCEGPVVATLDRHNASRLRRLETLDLTYFPDTDAKSLNNFELQHITTLKLPTHCTFRHLRIIGQRCPMLKNLDVSNSEKVTDPGLVVLKQCSKLTCVNISGCRAVQKKGINTLLSNHRGLEEIHLQWVAIGPEFLNEFVCPNIQRLGITTIFPIGDQHFRVIARRFPNLTSLKLNGCRFTCELSSLISLEKLAGLEFGKACFYDIGNLTRLLTAIGSRITSLKILWHQDGLMQRELNPILSNCVNIEDFGFNYKSCRVSEEFVIPSLPKLKTLECYLIHQYRQRKIEIVLAKPMPRLRRISYSGFSHTLQTIEEVILSGMHYPELAAIGMNFGSNGLQRKESLENIVKANNIDLLIEEYVPPQP